MRPWRRNLLKVPPGILQRARSFGKDQCQAACVKQIRAVDLQAGVYAHIGLSYDDAVACPEQALPLPTTGRYSSYNVHGREVVLRDEPMTTKSWSLTSPNYGDWSKGSHESVVHRDVYRRDNWSPWFLTIRIACIGKDILGQWYTFRFTVDRVLDRRSPDFLDDLLYDLNLLQENVGNHNLYESDAPVEEFLKTLYVNWEILPPGERDNNIARIVAGLRPGDQRAKALVVERYLLLERLRPRCFVKGTSGFARYFGAQFGDDFVVFENVEYGNAIYVMRENWQTLSQRSRTELLASPDQTFVRIRHSKAWKAHLARVVAEYRRSLD